MQHPHILFFRNLLLCVSSYGRLNQFLEANAGEFLRRADDVNGHGRKFAGRVVGKAKDQPVAFVIIS